jgi:hypothetical protein
MFPIVPLLSLLAIFGGGATLLWYDNLSQPEKDRANRLTTQYANQLFGKTVQELTSAEASRVHNLVRRHFVN